MSISKSEEIFALRLMNFSGAKLIIEETGKKVLFSIIRLQFHLKFFLFGIQKVFVNKKTFL